MASNRVQKMLELQQLKRVISSNRSIYVVSDNKRTDMLLKSEIDYCLIEDIESQQTAHFTLISESDITTQEVDSLVEQMRGDYDRDTLDILLNSCMSSAVDSILSPFGLGHILFHDKDGGNVTTLHNAKLGVFANEADEARFTAYDRKVYEKGFSQKRKAIFQSNEVITDSYTRDQLTKDGRTHLDHVISAKEIHEQGKLFMTQDQRNEIANSGPNLKLTSSRINESKAEHDLIQWQDKECSERDGRTNAEKYGIDRERTAAAENEARDNWEPKLLKAKIQKYSTETFKTGVSEGLRMGAQQAIGLMLAELVASVFDEIRDIFENGFAGGKLGASTLQILKERLHRVGVRVGDRWNDVMKSFIGGSVSGFISNMITVVINMFITTEAKIVRMIREGFCSFLRAIQMMLQPPKGMTKREALHEGLKILAGGAAIIGGIALGEAIEHAIITTGVLAPFAGIISTAVSGIVTGLATSLIVYLIDKIDLFGVNSEHRHHYVLSKLDEIVDDSLWRAEQAMSVFEPPKMI